jgi:hypothetical protein
MEQRELGTSDRTSCAAFATSGSDFEAGWSA